MNTIDTKVILDCGAQSIHNNHPDALVRRTTLAGLLLTARAVRSIDAGLLAFRIWADPAAKQHEPSAILALANEKATS